MKFSPDGKVLTLGKAGVAGNPPDALTEPTSVLVAPGGDIFISEGHSGQGENAPPNTVARISKFTKDGKFIKSFGKLGSGPGEFRTPHDLAMDSQGRLFVADRGNMRIQILDQDGKYLAEWKQFSRPSGVYIRNDLIYVADSESNGVAPHPGWKGGSALDASRMAASCTGFRTRSKCRGRAQPRAWPWTRGNVSAEKSARGKWRNTSSSRTRIRG